MVVTVGFFDGVHLGHRKVLQQLLSYGDDVSLITFWPHPRIVLQQDAKDLSLLSSPEEKAQMLHLCGVSKVEFVKFTPEFAAMKAEDFIKDILIGRLAAERLVLGYDNRLGSDGLDTGQIASLCRKMGLEVDIVEPYIYKGVNVSSSAIRKALSASDVELAGQMLGYDYSVSGVVVPGNRIGRTINFPTANLEMAFAMKALPANGVYYTRVTIGSDPQEYYGMTNIGCRPTVGGDSKVVVETNIFDFDEDIYGKDMTVTFLRRIRDEIKFSSLQALKEQLEKDRQIMKSFRQ